MPKELLRQITLPRLILLFGLALAVPLGILAGHAYRGMQAEEAAALGFFAETLFDEIEGALAETVRREEGRPVEAYTAGAAGLARFPAEGFVRGYFQNNPDGSFQTPHTAAPAAGASDRAGRLAEIEAANRLFNRKRAEKTDWVREEPVAAGQDESKAQAKAFAGRYLDLSAFQRGPSVPPPAPERELLMREDRAESRTAPPAPPAGGKRRSSYASSYAHAPGFFEERRPEPDLVEAAAAFEGAPLQSMFLTDSRVFIFRRVLIDGRIHRQGFLLDVDALLGHLAGTYFASQPMTGFARLRLEALDQGRPVKRFDAGVPVREARFALERSFAPPFGFLRAALACERIPAAAGRATLNRLLAALAAVFLLGVAAIYMGARKIVDFSERQARFVSSVTHELKTPLTNIRMYIEMLEQGMARDPERERDYFRILQSEGARLSRLIGSVLELSRLEKRHRRPELRSGSFEDVLEEVRGLMEEGLRQGGFALTVENRLARPFRYDREIMVQVLINLVENSVKFGRSSPQKHIAIRLAEEGRRVRIELSDTGPGIPPADLKKVFHDFYRSKAAASGAAGGTGIGLALVRRFVALLGGEVSASNNPGPGCTFTIRLPA
jgi:signal transduction histidine kinase